MDRYRIQDAEWILSHCGKAWPRWEIETMCRNNVGGFDRSVEAYMSAYKAMVEAGSETVLSLYDDGEQEPHLILKHPRHKTVHVWLKSLTEGCAARVAELKAVLSVTEE